MNFLQKTIWLTKAYCGIISRPFRWWTRKDKKSPHISYAMMAEAIPNAAGWIIGAVVLGHFTCDITTNHTRRRYYVIFKNDDVIYAAGRMADDPEVKEALERQTTKYLNMDQIVTDARKTINMQVNLEAIILFVGTGLLLTLTAMFVGMGINAN